MALIFVEIQNVLKDYISSLRCVEMSDQHPNFPSTFLRDYMSSISKYHFRTSIIHIMDDILNQDSSTLPQPSVITLRYNHNKIGNTTHD